MAHEAELGLPPPPLAIEPRLGVRGAPVRVVGQPLAVEVHLDVASARGRFGRSGRRVVVLGPKALQGRPGLDGRAVHAEVISRSAEKPIISRSRSESALFSIRSCRAIISSVIGSSPVRGWLSQPDPTRQPPMTTPQLHYRLGHDPRAPAPLRTPEDDLGRTSALERGAAMRRTTDMVKGYGRRPAQAERLG